MVKYKYNSLVEFKFDNPKEYRFLKKTKQIERLCKDMGWFFVINKPAGYWTKERCIEESRKFNSKFEWFKSSFGSYKAAKKNGWYEECVANICNVKRKIKIKNNDKV
jgi:hypothetical protein